MFKRVRELEFENKMLRYDLAHMTEERDNWKDKAIEISHALTYAAECTNHKGLRLVKDPEADGPVPEMYHGA